MLTLANVHPHGRYLVVDDGGGIVVSGVIERLGGQWTTYQVSFVPHMQYQRLGTGRILAIGDSESPPVYHIMSQMNYPSSYIDNVFCSINWAYTDESWVPGTILSFYVSKVVPTSSHQSVQSSLWIPSLRL